MFAESGGEKVMLFTSASFSTLFKFAAAALSTFNLIKSKTSGSVMDSINIPKDVFCCSLLRFFIQDEKYCKSDVNFCRFSSVSGSKAGISFPELFKLFSPLIVPLVVVPRASKLKLLMALLLRLPMEMVNSGDIILSS